MTFTSCILLILRYSVHYESWLVYVSSNWLMSLTMAYFDKYYQRVFGKLDRYLKKFLYWIVTRGNEDAIRFAEYFEHHGNEREVRANTNREHESRATNTSTVSAPGSDAVKSATGGSHMRSVVHPTDCKGQTSDKAMPSGTPGDSIRVPSTSVNSERASTDSRSDAVIITVEELQES